MGNRILGYGRGMSRAIGTSVRVRVRFRGMHRSARIGRGLGVLLEWDTWSHGL